jgi:hypothetical protein
MDITIRGQQYSLTEVSDIQILPLAKLFGFKTPPDEDSPLYEQWQIETTHLFTEPANQAVVAYVLTSLFPNISPAIARYRLKRYDEGFAEVDFYLAINVDELLSILEAINPFIQARLTKTTSKPQGFGDKEKKKASLRAELAQLEA